MRAIMPVHVPFLSRVPPTSGSGDVNRKLK